MAHGACEGFGQSPGRRKRGGERGGVPIEEKVGRGLGARFGRRERRRIEEALAKHREIVRTDERQRLAQRGHRVGGTPDREERLERLRANVAADGYVVRAGVLPGAFERLEREMLEAALEHAVRPRRQETAPAGREARHEPADDRILVSEVGQMRQGRKILPDDFR